MSGNKKPYEAQVYFALALDPIHIGTGGFRLERVDMSIAREPGTNLPKLPGTSLAGACRTYAAMQVDGKFPRCAGQGQPDQGRGYEGHCGEPDCPVCVSFGFVRGGKSFQGLAQFSDARLLLFPVHSLAGPVWITCADVLRDLGVDQGEPPDDGVVRVANGVNVGGRLNLGWLMLDVERGLSLGGKMQGLSSATDVLERAVMVSNKMFGHIVNDNLEVRASVSIDPATGAASEGALFTYEALPRASVVTFETVVRRARYFTIAGKQPLGGDGGEEKVRETLASGLRLFEHLGIGGMNTRGMGRLRVLGLEGGGAK